MISIQCALCGKMQRVRELYKENFLTKKISSYTYSARRLPDRLHYRIVKCEICGIIFSNPVFPQIKIEKLYKKSKFTYDLESTFLKKTYAEYLKQILPSKNLVNLNLLEIGCGNGFFLEEALDLGIKNVYGVEPSLDSINMASLTVRRKIKNDVLRPYLFKDNSFDIICFFHTLDHVVNPNDFLEIVYSLLRKNGKVICIVHDTDGISVKLFGEKSPIFDIEHIYLFNKKNLTEIFKKNFLKPLMVSNIKNRYPLSYWLKLMPLSPNLKSKLSKFLSFVGIAKIAISISAGNQVIIAKKVN